MSSEPLKALFRSAARLPMHAALVLIAVYQRTLSPVLPALFGPACGCRFTPTCSHYAAGALRTHGFFAGLFLAARRLVKCTPLHPGGFDPVPPARPACLRMERADPNALRSTSNIQHRTSNVQGTPTAIGTGDRPFGPSPALTSTLGVGCSMLDVQGGRSVSA